MTDGYVIALDVGARRIGVALASNVAKLSAPHATIDRSLISDVFDHIAELVAKEDARVIVVGLPRGLQGQETAQTAEARAFARQLEARVKVPIVMQDEALTSAGAEDRLRQRGKPYDKGDIDAEAAAMILDDFLKTTERRSA